MLRGHVLGLWLFSVAILGFALAMVFLTLQGQFAGVQRMGSLMVFVGTISAFELINDRRVLASKRRTAEMERLRSEVKDTRAWIFGLQAALRRLDLKQDMQLATALDAKRELDATFDRLNERLAAADKDSAEELETIDLHATLNTALLVAGGTLVWGYGDLGARWLAGVLG